MSSTYPWCRCLGFGTLGRSLVVGVGFAFSLMIGGMTMNILGLPLPSFGGKPKPFQSLMSSLIAGTLTGLTLGPLGSRLNLPLFGRACLWLLLLFVLNGLINMVEAVFFTTIPLHSTRQQSCYPRLRSSWSRRSAHPVIPTAAERSGAACQTERDTGSKDGSVLGVALRARCPLLRADLLRIRNDRRPLRPALLQQPRPGLELGGAGLRGHPAA